MKKPKSFKDAIIKRDKAYKKFNDIEKQYQKAMNKVVDLDKWCNHFRTFGDKWEPIFERSINFSGMED